LIRILVLVASWVFMVTIAHTAEASGSEMLYTSDAGNFQLLYPKNWKVLEQKTELGFESTFFSPKKPLQPISFLIRGRAEEGEVFACPMGMIHVIDCKELANPAGEKYVRVVFTGQLSDSDHQYLKIFFQPKGALIEATMELTNEGGEPLRSVEEMEQVFNRMIASLKSTVSKH
jgi:hypothetical protein